MTLQEPEHSSNSFLVGLGSGLVRRRRISFVAVLPTQLPPFVVLQRSTARGYLLAQFPSALLFKDRSGPLLKAYWLNFRTAIP
jgi:hypothetical protein